MRPLCDGRYGTGNGTRVGEHEGREKEGACESHCLASVPAFPAHSDDYVCGNHCRVTRDAHAKAKNRRNQSSSTSALYLAFVSASLLSVLGVQRTRTYRKRAREKERGRGRGREGEHDGIVRWLVHGNHTSTGPSLFAIYASEIPKIGALLLVRSGID